MAAFDVIEDFEHGIDKIDLSGLRFNNSLSELRFIDSGSAFSGQKGEIQLNFDAFNGTTDLLMNTQSNSYAADFKIHVVGQVEQSDILLPEGDEGERKRAERPFLRLSRRRFPPRRSRSPPRRRGGSGPRSRRRARPPIGPA